MSEKPICLNYGCNKPVAHDGVRYRPFCAHCHMSGYKKTPLKEGVTPFKTGVCSNQNGHLGFNCPINYKKAPWARGKTHIDHIDGNYLNNTPENVDELCSLCHTYKGMLSGDFKNQNGRYNSLKKIDKL